METGEMRNQEIWKKSALPACEMILQDWVAEGHPVQTTCHVLQQPPATYQQILVRMQNAGIIATLLCFAILPKSTVGSVIQADITNCSCDCMKLVPCKVQRHSLV